MSENVLNPYRIPRPASISFSGGRTSGYMLYKIIEAYGGSLPEDIKVTFGNTGKEREETLRFVNDCAINFGVKIYWLEYFRDPERPVVVYHGSQPRIGCHSVREVTFETASRNGEPFRDLVQVKADFRKEAKDMPPVLPNPPQRFCSGELKGRTMARFLRGFGWDSWSTAVGLRAEEPSRVSSLKKQWSPDQDYVFPLFDAGVVEADVISFWRGMPFDLGLRIDPELGTYEGNCDLCFLKKAAKIKRIAQERPESVSWWAQMERDFGQTFRRDRFSFMDLDQGLVQLTVLPAEKLEDDYATCLCTD